MRSSGASPARGPTGSGSRRGSSPWSTRPAAASSAGTGTRPGTLLRLHARGDDAVPARHRVTRPRSHLLDGRRHGSRTSRRPRAPSTTTSSSASRRSRTRPSTTCASGSSCRCARCSAAARRCSRGPEVAAGIDFELLPLSGRARAVLARAPRRHVRPSRKPRGRLPAGRRRRGGVVRAGAGVLLR